MTDIQLPPLPHWCEAGSPFATHMQAYARAAIEAHEARKVPGGWQPIETAPENMDECVVVGWLNDDGLPRGEFDYKEDGCWIKWHEHAEHTEIIGGHGVSYTPPYTHWLKLPPLASAPPAPQASVVLGPTLTTCNCRWDGETQVQQCTLHESHVDAIHEWAERAKTAEAKLPAQQAKPQPLSDELIDEEWFEVHHLNINNVAKARLFARAIEAAHGITKDTP